MSFLLEFMTHEDEDPSLIFSQPQEGDHSRGQHQDNIQYKTMHPNIGIHGEN